MKILWDKKLIKLSNGSYIAWGLKRKKFFFANKNELKLNCTIIEYYEQRARCDEKAISDYKKIISELKAWIEKMKLCQNCKFEDNDYLEEPCSTCTRCLGNIKRKGNSDKWEIKEK